MPVLYTSEKNSLKLACVQPSTTHQAGTFLGVFTKVESFGIAEIKKFKTSSLITRTTNDITQIEMLLAMGLQLLIKSPVMAVWALLKQIY